MKNIMLIIGAIVLIGLVVGGVYFYSNSQPTPKPTTNGENISTRNAKMEAEFNEIMDEVIDEQSQKGVTFSVENIEVINLAGSFQGSIDLSCEKLEFETDESIIKSIANKLFLKYPNEFAEGSERDSRVYVRGCSETGGSLDGINTYSRTTEWRISDGYYNFAI